MILYSVNISKSINEKSTNLEVKMEVWEKEWAFRTLLDAATKTDLDKCNKRTELTDHPFKLSRLEESFKGNHLRHEFLQISFIGHPRLTDTDSMLREVVKLLTYSPIIKMGDINLKLRIIMAEASADDSTQHFIFYEVATPSKTVMCGGCTDHSGTGKSGKVVMDRIFALLEDIYRIKAEIVTIPHSVATTAIQRLGNDIHAYNKK